MSENIYITKENIRKVASENTKEEFLEKYYTDLNCPYKYDLGNEEEMTNQCPRIQCRVCWENALKELQFKQDFISSAEVLNYEDGTEFSISYKDGRIDESYVVVKNRLRNKGKALYWKLTKEKVGFTERILNAKFHLIEKVYIPYLDIFKHEKVFVEHELIEKRILSCSITTPELELVKYFEEIKKEKYKGVFPNKLILILSWCLNNEELETVFKEGKWYYIK